MLRNAPTGMCITSPTRGPSAPEAQMSEGPPEARHIVPALGVNLSKRQTEVLTLILQQLSNKEIGARLNIAEKTVKWYVWKLLVCAGAKSRRELLGKLGHFEVTVRWVPNEGR